MQRSNFDALQVRIHTSRTALGETAAEGAADVIRTAIAANGAARVIFACAPSQDEFLAALVREKIAWGKVTIFHMDEYVGLEAARPQSFRHYLSGHLLAQIATPLDVHLIRAEQEPEEECQRYTALLKDDPIDLVCMGIGENGHIAFNDPPVADFHDPRLVKIVELDEACRWQQVNDGCFPTFESVPTHAVTLTIPALLGARKISCVVPGERKAQAVRDALLGPVSVSCPASILRTHPGAVLHLDTASAARLSA